MCPGFQMPKTRAKWTIRFPIVHTNESKTTMSYHQIILGRLRTGLVGKLNPICIHWTQISYLSFEWQSFCSFQIFLQTSWTIFWVFTFDWVSFHSCICRISTRYRVLHDALLLEASVALLLWCCRLFNIEPEPGEADNLSNFKFVFQSKNRTCCSTFYFECQGWDSITFFIRHQFYPLDYSFEKCQLAGHIMG